jgi:hypothetical protein
VINDISLVTSGAIHQISTTGFENIQSFQTINMGTGNSILSQQIGDQNKASIIQKSDPGTGLPNQSYTFQQGNYNEMTIGQIGSGNLLLSFQIGYLSSEISPYQSNLFGFGLENSVEPQGAANESNAILTFGERNKLIVTQEGSNNGIMALQQGDDNSASAEQKGINTYLLIIQNGNMNTVSEYKQENSSETNLYDTVIQNGERLSLNVSDVSRAKQTGNIFSQSGINLSLQVNNGFVNSLGGIEITQTGREMKVVIDQSYFSLPMK